MKFGVLTFGYDSFTNFPDQLASQGFYETNLGDNAQSIAIRNIYRHYGILDDQMVEINRDSLPHYDGEPVILLMNGVFYRSSFPLPEAITPIFIGFHAPEHVINEQAELLARHQPIGCRDGGTTALVRKLDIEAFTTGCLTFSLPQRDQPPKNPKLLIVYGSGAGRLPPAVFRYVPEQLLTGAELIYHRFHASKFPFDAGMRKEAESYEEALFGRYRREAALVLTSLHHVAAPCMAFGIPTIICRERNDIRFSFIQRLTSIYTPERFSQINWNPTTVDVAEIRSRLLRIVGDRLFTALSAN